MPFHTPDPDFVGPPAPPSLLDRIISGIGSFVEGVTQTAATVAAVSGILQPDVQPLTVDTAPVQPAPSGRAPLLGGAGLPLLLIGGVVLAVLFLPR